MAEVINHSLFTEFDVDLLNQESITDFMKSSDLTQ